MLDGIRSGMTHRTGRDKCHAVAQRDIRVVRGGGQRGGARCSRLPAGDTHSAGTASRQLHPSIRPAACCRR